MTAVPNPRSVASQDADHPIAPRLIGVGVHDVLHDRAPITWALLDAVPGRDSVHLVHAYVPLRLDGCAWGPVSQVRDRRHTTAGRVVAQAVQRATETHRGLEVGGSAVAGLADDVLIELSGVVDLLVIGDDTDDPLVTRKITSRVQDHTHCPVVSVPPDYQPDDDDRPVTVVVDEFGLSEEVMTFAAELAIRHERTLQVSRAWSALHEGRLDGPGWLAEQQEELDAQLAAFQAAYPRLGLAARLELGYAWLNRLRCVSSVLVTGARSADLLRTPGDGPHNCAVAIVPD